MSRFHCRIHVGFAGLLFFAFGLMDQAPQSTGTKPVPGTPDIFNRLPVKRVVLYKNGVGYFEHLGSVHDNNDVTISFTSGQLNDVLKSLTVLDLNGGKITGVA